MPVGNGFLREREEVSILLIKVFQAQHRTTHVGVLQRVMVAIQKKHKQVVKFCLVTLRIENAVQTEKYLEKPSVSTVPHHIQSNDHKSLFVQQFHKDLHLYPQRKGARLKVCLLLLLICCCCCLFTYVNGCFVQFLYLLFCSHFLDHHLMFPEADHKPGIFPNPMSGSVFEIA